MLSLKKQISAKTKNNNNKKQLNLGVVGVFPTPHRPHLFQNLDAVVSNI